jgi:thioredoxin reductase
VNADTRPLDLPVERVPVAVIGGGPSGLTAAANLSSTLESHVLVIEREAEMGGIPRHSDHPGYGIRDLHRFISGPTYARRLTAAARDAGATLETEAQVTGWDGARRLVLTTPRGRRIVEADAVVLATGARERPRPARLIPGDRPDGVYTTGQLQNLVHIHHAEVGRRAVVVGAELVSWSAVMTLREAGCSVVAMTSQYERSEAYAAFRAFGRVALRLPVRTRSRLVQINGKQRVESVVLENIDTGRREIVACDTVVTTGDWIPDNELARTGGLEIDAGTKGPVVDNALRTTGDGIFAVGNLIHPVDTADAAALDGQHVVHAVQQWLDSGTVAQQGATVRVRPGEAFRWVTPQNIAPGANTPRDQLLLWTDTYQRFPKVRAVQDGKTIGEMRVAWPASPGRVFRVPSSLLEAARAGGGSVAIELV